VLPGDTSVPTSLLCVQDCPTGATLADGVSDADSPFTTASTAGTPLQSADATTYTWDAANYRLSDDASPPVEINKDTPVSGGVTDHWTYGISTGPLVDPADASQLYCDGTALPYCNHLTWSVTTTYQFEFGPMSHSNMVFLRKADNTIVHFSPPMTVDYTVPANTDGDEPYGKLAGASLLLHSEGFGSLHGFPGHCFDDATNEPADCTGSGTRYLPSISIPEGGSVTVEGVTKWVKPLEYEKRLKLKSGVTASAAGVTLGEVSSLPTPLPIGTDPKDPKDPSNTQYYAGAFSMSLFEEAPKVIHGKLMTNL